MSRLARMALAVLVLGACPLVSRAQDTPPADELPPVPPVERPPEPGPQPAPSAEAPPARQPPPTLQPGSYIRLKDGSTRQWLTGSVDAIDDQRVTVVDKEGVRTTLPLASVRRMEILAGKRHEFGKAALIGGAVGLGLGLILPLPKPDICFGESCDEPMWDRQEQEVGMLVVGLLTGLIAEGVSDPRAPRWERVTPPYRPPPAASVEVGPGEGGRGVACRATFSF